VLSRLRPNGYSGIAVDITGVSAVENILFSKYQMYRAVYWHRTVRVATAMIKKVLFMALRDGAVAPRDLYGLDDDLFYGRFADSSYAPLTLLKAVYNRRLHKTIVDVPYRADFAGHGALESVRMGVGRGGQKDARAMAAGRLVRRDRGDASVPVDLDFHVPRPARGQKGLFRPDQRHLRFPS
jgi:HD superfamily phosphohydrolase